MPGLVVATKSSLLNPELKRQFSSVFSNTNSNFQAARAILSLLSGIECIAAKLVSCASCWVANWPVMS